MAVGLRRLLLATAVSLGVAGVASAQPASPPAEIAAEPKPAAEADKPPAAPATFWSTFKVSGHVEAGVTFEPDQSPNKLNFGHLFTDRANEPLLNQALLTAERPIDPKSAGFDFGFRVQAMFGSDARFTRFTGEFEDARIGRHAFDLVEANLQAHLPILTKGGLDLKVGQYATPIGYEVIDGAGNPFYSHSYIFNFGIPLKHTGALATAHVTPILDLYLGVDSGVNTALGDYDNNNSAAVLGGFGLNFDKVTILALTHIGPENAYNAVGVRPNIDKRYLSDVVVTWKVSPKLTSVTEINYIREDGYKADGGGVAQYLSYTLNDNLTLNARGEIWRDAQGFFVAAFPGANDLLYAEEGRPYAAVTAPPTTYGAITVGAAWKPPGVPKLFDGLVIRPELRYDRSLNDTTPFHAGTADDQFTLGVDVIVPFTVTH